jgi:hypothetical protein
MIQQLPETSLLGDEVERFNLTAIAHNIEEIRDVIFMHYVYYKFIDQIFGGSI